ncbi:Uncharacterized protein BP5553_05126 [Venustampulla echinocandica]|uniref:PPPDE domain-containing protein n=1 Tax=Venustampulla echinocandica TaxID=2656787 RepID=A0A370TQ96_9HELO|nr:Uncharacterized protein BP5553_05126 [Venustampulla echinocandica]RDL37693.1 Uncharacterized protein BP5553_05126 [Venustampulla echinocandica]
MSDSPEPSEPEHQSKRAMLGAYLHDGWSKGKERSKDELLKGKLALQHSLGLGAKPNIIPPGEARVDGDLRTVEIGWHPVAGMGGKWFAEKSGVGELITKNIGGYPDPTQHWAVLVGGYVHQLWMDEELDVIYINEELDREEWHTFEVGGTRFTDEALRQAGEMVIHNMREKRPAYNVISNNCQNYAVLLLDAIQIGAHQEFATSFAVYQAATGAGTIKDLFADKHPEEQKPHPERPELHRVDTVQNAQQVMDENTTKLDNHRSFF